MKINKVDNYKEFRRKKFNKEILDKWYASLHRFNLLQDEFNKKFYPKKVSDYYNWWAKQKGISFDGMGCTDILKYKRMALLELEKNNWRFDNVAKTKEAG